MVKHCINDSISYCLGYYLLCLFVTIHQQLWTHVLYWNLWVCYVYLLQTKLKDSVFKSQNQSVVLVSLEQSFILLQDPLKSLHIPLFDTRHYFIVWSQWLLIVCLRKDLPVRNLSHQQLYYNQQFLNVNPEPLSPTLWSLPQSLDQTSLCFWVLKLDGLNSTNVVQIPSLLVVWSSFWERCFN